MSFCASSLLTPASQNTFFEIEANSGFNATPCSVSEICKLRSSFVSRMRVTIPFFRVFLIKA